MKQCNRYANGFCSTLNCMKRGGYVRGESRPGDREMATCEAHELYCELLELRQIRDGL